MDAHVRVRGAARLPLSSPLEGRSAPGTFWTTLVQFSNQPYEHQAEPREIVTSRRPPIVTVDQYRRRRADPVAASE